MGTVVFMAMAVSMAVSMPAVIVFYRTTSDQFFSQTDGSDSPCRNKALRMFNVNPTHPKINTIFGFSTPIWRSAARITTAWCTQLTSQ